MIKCSHFQSEMTLAAPIGSIYSGSDRYLLYMCRILYNRGSSTLIHSPIRPAVQVGQPRSLNWHSEPSNRNANDVCLRNYPGRRDGMFGYVAQSPQVLYVVKAPKQSSRTPESVYGAPTDPSDHNLCPSNGIVCKYREQKYPEIRDLKGHIPIAIQLLK